MSFFLFYSTRRWFILSNIIFLVLNSLLTHDPNSYGSSSSSIFFFFFRRSVFFFFFAFFNLNLLSVSLSLSLIRLAICV